jgi:hypothetical protein
MTRGPLARCCDMGLSETLAQTRSQSQLPDWAPCRLQLSRLKGRTLAAVGRSNFCASCYIANWRGRGLMGRPPLFRNRLRRRTFPCARLFRTTRNSPVGRRVSNIGEQTRSDKGCHEVGGGRLSIRRRRSCTVNRVGSLERSKRPLPDMRASDLDIASTSRRPQMRNFQRLGKDSLRREYSSISTAYDIRTKWQRFLRFLEKDGRSELSSVAPRHLAPLWRS